MRAVQIVGDGAAQVRSLTAGLVARGVQVSVCAAEDSHDFASAGAQFVRGNAALRAVCGHADVVHAHGTAAALRAALALQGRRIPLVVTWHNAERAEGLRAQVARILEARAARAARVVLGVSSDLVDRARDRGARDARYAPVAVPAPRRPVEGSADKLRAELGVIDRPLLVTIGSLEASRSYGTLLDAAREWRSMDVPPLLAVAGEGPQREWLQSRIEVERLPVSLLGERTDAADLLASADLALLAGTTEARSVLAQEALHVGVPLVAADFDGSGELLGDAAELVPAGDGQAFGRAVVRLLDSPQRRQELVERGLEQAANWPTEDDSVAQVLSVYDEVTGQSA